MIEVTTDVLSGGVEEVELHLSGKQLEMLCRILDAFAPGMQDDARDLCDGIRTAVRNEYRDVRLRRIYDMIQSGIVSMSRRTSETLSSQVDVDRALKAAKVLGIEIPEVLA